jgi:hypothetical protein
VLLDCDGVGRVIPEEYPPKIGWGKNPLYDIADLLARSILDL